MCVGLLRFMLQGWVETLYIKPTFFFKYTGFEWVVVPSPTMLYALFILSALSALFVCVGYHYRVAIVIFASSFTYIQLMDVTNYLNHYVLVCLVAWAMVFAPLHRCFSIDAWRSNRNMSSTLPREILWWFRFQFAVVYLNAALAKFTSDWLLHAQPMGIWMRARSETFLIGPFLNEAWCIYLLSWSGFLYDLLIVPFLLHKKTRAYAYVVVLVFHAMTSVFFDIGLFPFIMSIGTTLFFAPEWPRGLAQRLGRRLKMSTVPSPKPLPRIVLVTLLAACVLQVAVPLRHYFLEGDVLWNERGMRFAWKVMVREKNGSVTLQVIDRQSQRRWDVSPNDYLTWRQANEMSSQPDLIVQLAKHVAWDFKKRGHDTAVYADTWVSLNGRKRAKMLDPTVDLTQLSSHAPAPVLQVPTSSPLKVR